MSIQPYRLSVQANSEMNRGTNQLSVYFKGDQGLTQTLFLPLKDGLIQQDVDLLDVGNLSVAHLKLNRNDARWKIENLELERKSDKDVLNFPVQYWLDSNRTYKVDALINEGPVQLAPIYTITINTGTISRCSHVDIKLALIGDGASTLPLDLVSDGMLNRSAKQDLFQSGGHDQFFISPFETMDVGQLFHIQLQCDTHDPHPYYCESVEVVNNLTEKKYFIAVNNWFGPNLEHQVLLPVVDRQKENNIYTISVKTSNVSDSVGVKSIQIQMTFNNGKILEEELSTSETHQIPFQKDQIDFFTLSINEPAKSEITDAQIRLGNSCPPSIQWQGAWIEIRDVFYQKHYCYILREPLDSGTDGKTKAYVHLERIVDIPCLNHGALRTKKRQ